MNEVGGVVSHRVKDFVSLWRVWVGLGGSLRRIWGVCMCAWKLGIYVGLFKDKLWHTGRHVKGFWRRPLIIAAMLRKQDGVGGVERREMTFMVARGVVTVVGKRKRRPGRASHWTVTGNGTESGTGSSELGVIKKNGTNNAG